MGTKNPIKQGAKAYKTGRFVDEVPQKTFKIGIHGELHARTHAYTVLHHPRCWPRWLHDQGYRRTL
eukprot:5716405-Amphidinium_carterae.1